MQRERQQTRRKQTSGGAEWARPGLFNKLPVRVTSRHITADSSSGSYAVFSSLSLVFQATVSVRPIAVTRQEFSRAFPAEVSTRTPCKSGRQSNRVLRHS